MRPIPLLATLALLSAAPALAQESQSATPAPEAEARPPEATIPFANLGGIRNWRADGNSAILIEGRNRTWYRAELMGPCPDLGFTEKVGFASEPSGSFDRFSAIIVRDRICQVRSLVETEAPGKKKK